MKNGIVLAFRLALFFFLIPDRSAGQQGTWLLGGGSEFNEKVVALTTDGAGNIYMVVNFSDTLVFGTDTLYPNGTTNFLVSRIDSSGNRDWIKRFGGFGDTWAHDIALDASGDLYVVGEFLDSTILDTDTVYANYSITECGLMIKLDTLGNLIRHYETRGPGGEFLYAIAAGSNAMYFTGKYRDIGIVEVDTLWNYGVEDLWLIKVDTAGPKQWFAKAGSKRLDAGLDIAVSLDTLVTVCGYFQDTVIVTVDSVNTAISRGDRDILLIQYNSSGQYRWHLSGGGTGTDMASGIAADSFGNVFVSGTFDSILIIAGDTIQTVGDLDMFLMKVDMNGNVTWIQTYGYSEYDGITDVAVTPTGGAVVSGYFQDLIIIGDTLDSGDPTNQDAFLASFDASGNPEWAIKASGATIDGGESVAVDPNGNIAFGGYFNLDLTINQVTISSSEPDDFFLARVFSDGTVRREFHYFSESEKLKIFPNPAAGFVTIQSGGLSGNQTQMQILDLQGRILYSEVVTSEQIRHGKNIILAEYTPGMYIVNLYDFNSHVSARLMIY